MRVTAIHRVATPRQTHPSLGLHKTPVSTFAPAATRVFFLVLNQSKLCSPQSDTQYLLILLRAHCIRLYSQIYRGCIPRKSCPLDLARRPVVRDLLLLIPHPSFLAHQPPRSTTFNHQHHQKITPPSEKKKKRQPTSSTLLVPATDR